MLAQVPAGRGYEVKEIKGGLYWVTDGAYNTMFLVTRDGVIGVDALPTMGERQIAAIREVTDKPIRYLVYSHEHTDHIGAASLFPSGIKIVAQAETAAALTAQRPMASRAHCDVPRPSHAVARRPKTGAHLSGPQSSDRQHIIWAPRQKTLMLVDVVYPGYMPYKNLGIVEDVPGYIDVHRTVLGYDFDTFVGGHVDRLGTRADVETSLEFVTELHSVESRGLSKTPFPAFLAAHAGLTNGSCTTSISAPWLRIAAPSWERPGRPD